MFERLGPDGPGYFHGVGQPRLLFHHQEPHFIAHGKVPGKLLGRFVEGGILKRTAYAVIHRSATRYAWVAGEPTP